MFYVVTFDQDFLINKYFYGKLIFFVRRERNVFLTSYCEIRFLNYIPQGPSNLHDSMLESTSFQDPKHIPTSENVFNIC